MDRSLIGRTAEPFTMVVELGKIQEFARATKSSNPAYAGGPGDQPVSPATFLASAQLWQRPENSPLSGVNLNWERILHGEQAFTFHCVPPKAGDVLTGVTRIDTIYEKAGKRGGTMIFAEQVTEFRNTDGHLVAEARSVMIETSKSTTES